MMREITGMLVTAIASANTSTKAVRSPAGTDVRALGQQRDEPQADEERHDHAGHGHRGDGASFVGPERRADLRARR